jgi:hypothetical protein
MRWSTFFDHGVSILNWLQALRRRYSTAQPIGDVKLNVWIAKAVRLLLTAWSANSVTPYSKHPKSSSRLITLQLLTVMQSNSNDIQIIFNFRNNFNFSTVKKLFLIP